MKHWKYRPFVLLLVFVLFACTAIPAVMATSTRVTALTIRVDGPVYATVPFTITGKLTGGPTGVPVSDKQITVSRSTNGKRWTVINSNLWTDGSGTYTLTVTEPAAGKVFYRTSFAGDKIFKAVTSPTWTVTVNPRISTKIEINYDESTQGIIGYLEDNTGQGINGQEVLFLYSVDHGVTWIEPTGPYGGESSNPDTSGFGGPSPMRDGFVQFKYLGDLMVGRYKAVFTGDTTIYEPSESNILVVGDLGG